MVRDLVQAVMTACFAYIGYAVGGLLLAAMANANAAAAGTAGVDIEAAGANLKMQFMFVVAFLVNAITVFWVARRWQAGRIALPAIFLLFWFIDAAVPLLYQTFILGGSYIPTALLLGLFPAGIIALSMRMMHSRPAVHASK